MGIKNLNRFLLDNCSEKSIKKQHLGNIKGKPIVVDASIYLYKFQTDELLMENMYLLVSILLQYNILPIFVFDGKPPPEKKELLTHRHRLKLIAEKQYNELKNLTANNPDISIDEKKEIMEELVQLKKQFVRIRDEDIKNVKSLLDAYGIPYIDAPGEADQVCVHMVKTKKAWACLSDDMDMFVYGCPRVIRFISLMQHTAIFYDMNLILKELCLSIELFREIMVLSGTDYNINENTSLEQTVKWLYKYKKYCTKEASLDKLSFYDWLHTNTKYIDDYDSLLNVYKMFELDNDMFIEIQNRVFKKDRTDKSKLHEIMGQYGFVYTD